MGTLGLGDLLGLIRVDEDGGLAHDTISALAKSDAGAAIFAVARPWRELVRRIILTRLQFGKT